MKYWLEEGRQRLARSNVSPHKVLSYYPAALSLSTSSVRPLSSSRSVVVRDIKGRKKQHISPLYPSQK